MYTTVETSIFVPRPCICRFPGNRSIRWSQPESKTVPTECICVRIPHENTQMSGSLSGKHRLPEWPSRTKNLTAVDILEILAPPCTIHSTVAGVGRVQLCWYGCCGGHHFGLGASNHIRGIMDVVFSAPGYLHFGVLLLLQNGDVDKFTYQASSWVLS